MVLVWTTIGSACVPVGCNLYNWSGCICNHDRVDYRNYRMGKSELKADAVLTSTEKPTFFRASKRFVVPDFHAYFSIHKIWLRLLGKLTMALYFAVVSLIGRISLGRFSKFCIRWSNWASLMFIEDFFNQNCFPEWQNVSQVDYLLHLRERKLFLDHKYELF